VRTVYQLSRREAHAIRSSRSIECAPSADAAIDFDDGVCTMCVGGVVSYARAGRQFVAFTSGNTSPASFGAAVGRPTVVVMALPTKSGRSHVSAAADAARGRQVYAQACAACHGPDGDKIMGRDLRSVGLRMNSAQISSFIRNPAPPMPRVFPAPRTQEDERDLRDVAAFVARWARASAGPHSLSP